jgi:hypothetical protein
MRRPVWLAAGVALGVGGTLWAEQRVRRQVRRVADSLRPAGLVGKARDRGDAARGRVRAAIDAGRLERDQREAELWSDLDGANRPHTSARPRHGRHSTPR